MRPTANGSGKTATANPKNTTRGRAPTNLRLLPPFICKETVALAEALRNGARSGAVVGFAIAVAARDSTYVVDTAGVFRADPTYARGAVASLDDKLRSLVQESTQ